MDNHLAAKKVAALAEKMAVKMAALRAVVKVVMRDALLVEEKADMRAVVKVATLECLSVVMTVGCLVALKAVLMADYLGK